MILVFEGYNMQLRVWLVFSGFSFSRRYKVCLFVKIWKVEIVLWCIGREMKYIYCLMFGVNLGQIIQFLVGLIIYKKVFEFFLYWGVSNNIKCIFL